MSMSRNHSVQLGPKFLVQIGNSVNVLILRSALPVQEIIGSNTNFINIR